VCVLEQVELLTSTALRSVVVVAVILATLVATVHALTALGLDEGRAEELGVVLSLMVVVYLVLQATVAPHPVRPSTRRF